MDELAEQINAQVVRILSELRKKQGLSHQALADRAGLNRSYIGHLEAGIRKPSLEVAFRLSLALGQPLSRIIGQAEWKMGLKRR